MKFFPTILIVQFRTDQSEAHDEACFREVFQNTPVDLVFVNPIKGTMPKSVPENVNGVILGGSAQFYMTKNDGEGSWRDDVMQLVDDCFTKNIPLLGVCFGFQLLAVHEGARVITDPTTAEAGTYKISLLDRAATHPLFCRLPKTYLAQLAHRDTAVDFPDHLVPFARSEKVAVQAYEVAGRQAWGVMYHPELNMKRMKERISHYPEYAEDQSKLDSMLDAFHSDSPFADGVLHGFLAYVNEYIKEGSASHTRVTRPIVTVSQSI
ncbi:MAG TPA: hypothetical protein DCY48_00485 [Candidatus Magasanikbacteria bacterium]|nr:MAG: hypothetical protein A3I74_02615 [Candidatus Magasanikbacteria bacterium RIFCSPLOWO2_02_FULL_47_16]OGH79604.1 MAG: hypothetical protein A3C10_00785 [Candidatus Magasanikbacteria bacterium RIFCSPHIGHO2_02_FULL_48_18]OGH82019.1 MAG: hypothetical protein A3G08_02295 [Candidatus Magasanikbacteria bacterium RIFCSPLOWO2_12_FULL_47_9b]HAZ28242.1 hypothetical protein [Candidatus Magasanikbacteria bacterium]